jgi:hypothetical protein
VIDVQHPEALVARLPIGIGTYRVDAYGTSQ